MAKETLETLINEGRKNPKVEPADVLASSRERMKQRKADKQAMTEIDLDTAEMESEVLRLQEEVAERKRRIAAGEPPPKRDDKPSSRESLIALSMALLNNGVDPAIVGQILAGQSANGAIRNPQITLGGGVPDWMGKIVADAISSKDDVKIARVESEMKRLEDKLGAALTATTEAIKNIGKTEPVDPVTIATRQAEAIAATFNALKVIGLIPERTPQVSNSETAFRVQDRQWLHEERIGLLQTEREKIESQERLEAQKAGRWKDTLAQFPQIIGQTAAKALEDGTVERKKRRSERPEAPAGRRKRPVIYLEEGEAVATVECLECGQPISVVAGSKQALCAGCGMKYPVITKPSVSPPVTGETSNED